MASVARGAVLGSFSDDTSFGAVVGQVGVGLTPAGVAADFRDAAAAASALWRGEAGSGYMMAGSLIGFVPGVGDAAKVGLNALARGARAAVTHAVPPAMRAAAQALSRTIGREVSEVLSQGTQRQARTWDMNGGQLGFSARTADVRFADGTTGRVYEVFPFKMTPGSNIPMNQDSAVQRQLEHIRAEILRGDPKAVVVTRRPPYDTLPTHVSGLGAHERAWVR